MVAGLLDRFGPLLGHLADDACIGSISEVLSGDSPHRPAAAAAQAWSVAELLRTYALPGEEPGASIKNQGVKARPERSEESLESPATGAVR